MIGFSRAMLCISAAMHSIALCNAMQKTAVLTAGEDDEMFMTRSLNVTPKTTEQCIDLTACSDKSVAYVTNNKRLYSTFCTVEANY